MSEKLVLPENLHDLLLEVNVIFEKHRVRIKDLIEKVQIGSILKLDKVIGDSCDCDICVQNKKIAEGQIIVVDDEKYGVRITNIL